MALITNQIIPIIGGKRHGYFVVDDDYTTPHQIKVAGEIYEYWKYRFAGRVVAFWRLRGLSDDDVERLIPLGYHFNDSPWSHDG